MFSELKRHTNKTILCWSECLELTVANLRVASWRLSWARRLGLPSCNSLFRALARAARISPSPASLRFKDDTCLGPASWWPCLENTELLKEGKLCTVPGCLEAAGPRAAYRQELLLGTKRDRGAETGRFRLRVSNKPLSYTGLNYRHISCCLLSLRVTLMWLFDTEWAISHLETLPLKKSSPIQCARGWCYTWAWPQRLSRGRMCISSC